MNFIMGIFSLLFLEKKDSCVRKIFIDFSSAFNIVIPKKLVEKLVLLGVNTSLYNWILDFLTNRPQYVSIGNNNSEILRLSTGSPLVCLLSPLLFPLLKPAEVLC